MRRVVPVSAAMAALITVGVTLLFHGVIYERWLIHRLSHSDRTVRSTAAQELLEREFLAAIPHLLRAAERDPLELAGGLRSDGTIDPQLQLPTASSAPVVLTFGATPLFYTLSSFYRLYPEVVETAIFREVQRNRGGPESDRATRFVPSLGTVLMSMFGGEFELQRIEYVASFWATVVLRGGAFPPRACPTSVFGHCNLTGMDCDTSL